MQPPRSPPAAPRKSANGADASRIAFHRAAIAAAADVVEIDRTIEVRANKVRRNKPHAPRVNKVPNSVNHNVNHAVPARKAIGLAAGSASCPRKCSRSRSPTF
jgi:hypothetical protein